VIGQDKQSVLNVALFCLCQFKACLYWCVLKTTCMLHDNSYYQFQNHQLK